MWLPLKACCAEAPDAAMFGPSRLSAIPNVTGKAGCLRAHEDIELEFRAVEDGQRSVILRDGRRSAGPAQMDTKRFSGPGTVAQLLRPFAINVPWKMRTTL